MQVKDAIRSRRAAKQFDADHNMTDDEITQLMELGRLAPTAFNMQHCRFVCVTEPSLKAEIRAVSWDQAQVTDCSLLVIVCADTMAWDKYMEQLWEAAAPAAKDFIFKAIHDYYAHKPAVQRDEAMRSCGLAAQTLMLAAEEMGYASCPMDGFDFTEVANLINLPEDHLISMFVAIGKPTSEPRDRPGNMRYDEVVIHNRFAAL